MKLFIVESPAKCKKIKSYLGEDYTVEASYGHVRSIPPKGMNVDTKNFEPSYHVDHKKADTVRKLKQLAGKASDIFLATDPDREGEGISWHLYELFDAKDKKKCVRVTFNEITKSAILDAIKNSRQIDMDLVHAQKARQVLDRLIGYSASPLLWYSLGRGLSAGRVQSVALRMICERQKEIDAFVPEDYWFIDSLLGCNTGKFNARVVTEERDNKYKDEKVAAQDLEKLKSTNYTLEKIEKKLKSISPYPPFDTASLTIACHSLFGWSASRTMQVAQTLYEQGQSSYLRTDSYNVSKEAMEEARAHIKGMGKEYLPDGPNHYSKKSSASAQEAHECIRPIHAADDGFQLDGDEKRLYDLIRARFLASQMTPMTVDTVTYHVRAGTGHMLVAHGQVVRFEGWFKAYPYSKVKDELLPEAKEGEKLELKHMESSKHSTQPPARYNDGSLVKKMEEEGVGRPSTRAPIIKALQDKEYIDKNDKAFTATELGMRICDYLVPRFDDFFMNVRFTAGLEEDLDLIANNKKSYLDVVGSVYGTLIKKIAEAKATTKKENVATGAKCPVCKKGDVVEKMSRFGKFYSCSLYPKCSNILVKKEDGTFAVKEKAVKEYSAHPCPKCGGKMVMRTSRYGKFQGCAKYPKCRGMRKEDGEEVESKGRRFKKRK